MPKEQYLWQDENGERASYVVIDGQRVPLTWVTFPRLLEAYKGTVVQIPGPAPHIKVACLEEHKKTRPSNQRLNWGGSAAERNPFDFGKEYAKGGARVHQLRLN